MADKSIVVALACIAATFAVHIPLAEARASVARAERAVEREVKAEYNTTYAEVNCRRLTARRFFCRWYGHSRRDVQEGNVRGWEGTARATAYGRRFDVRLRVTHRGY